MGLIPPFVVRIKRQRQCLVGLFFRELDSDVATSFARRWGIVG